MKLNTNVEFSPIQCTSKQFAGFAPTEGFLYFLTDTKQLFLGKNNAFIEMCGGINLRYGKKEIEYDNSGITPDPHVNFYLEDLEEKVLPLVDDLILNIDGCFYRVTGIDDEEIIRTERLTLQGTGTGGGGSGGGGAAANLRISHYGGQNRYFSRETDKAELSVVAYSDDSANYISSVECSFMKDFAEIFTAKYNLSHPLEKPYYISIFDQLDQISTTGTKIYMRVTDKYGSTREIYFTVTIASLQLASSEPPLFGVMSNTYDYECVVGGSNTLDSRTIRYELYSTGVMPIYTTEQVLEKNQTGSITKTLDLSTIAHGDYTLRVRLLGVVSGVTIESNELVHKIVRYREDVGQPVFSALIPEKTEQYTSIPISYLLVYGNTAKDYLMDILVDDEVLTTQSVTSGVVQVYNVSFDKKGSYKLTLKINELGIDYTVIMDITEYTGVLPIINIDRDDLKVYLTARGRTNNAADRDKWSDYKTPAMQGTLSNFYYRSVNGWLEDKNQNPYLKVSQGASVNFDAFSPYDIDPKEHGLTIELDFMIAGVTNYSTHLMECLSYDAAGAIKTGFAITGDTFKYYASGNELVSLNLVQNQRIKLSFVVESSKSQKYPMCYTYLNGIISNVHRYEATDSFTNAPAVRGYLKIDSTAGDVNVYGVRFYSSALDAHTVVNNYMATLDTLDMRRISYEHNLIRNIDGDIDLDLIEAETYDLEIPYIKIIGGYQINKDKDTGDMIMAASGSNNKPALPVGKKDYRAIDIEVHYPTKEQNPYFDRYTNLNIISKFKNSNASVIDAFGKTMAEGAWMYAQGTSSLEYPIKNLRVKTKGSNNKFIVRPDIEPVNLITFKADFMESSGSHNTGAANFIDTAYSYAGMKTPGQKQFAQYDDASTIVTCIKGHPCVIFWSPTGEKGTFQYIGKYNLNLDKATPEPFGFMEDEQDEQFGYLVNEAGELVLDDNGNKQNSIFCFEFLDNNEKVCNFESDEESTFIDYDAENPKKKEEYDINDKTEQERYYDSWYSKRINEDGDIVPGWARGFESRYPEDKVDTPDADALWPFASWLNNLYSMRYLENREAEALQKFKDEYYHYLDHDFLIAYYVITEALLMADSRVKNMMIATWGKEWQYRLADGTITKVRPSKGSAVTGTPTGNDYNEHFGYIWYPIFYDMDTMLGLDNIGYVTKPYYGEDTTEDLFNGDEILWKFVRDALFSRIVEGYNKLESANSILSKNGILPYFNDNQAKMANETFYNEDAFYKYIDTYRNGYTNHLTGEEVKPGTGTRLYAAQGDRSMMREWFVANRIKYLRGKYMSTHYQEGDRIEFRLTYPKNSEATGNQELTTDEQRRMNASIEAVPPTGNFTYKAMKTGYAGVKVGTAFDNRRFIDGQEQILSVDTTSGNGTETYLYGISNLSDVGDLSDKYLYKLVIKTDENNLKRLILGNHHKDYYNPYWGKEESIILTGFNYLEEFNFENCATFTKGIDFRDCPRIKTILLNGSGTTSLMLPPSGVIEELRVPSSVKNFAIDSHPTLEVDKFTLGYFDYDQNKYINDFSKLTDISIKNTPIDSYAIVQGAVVNADPILLESYCFNGINWTITDVKDLNVKDGVLMGITALDNLSKLNPYSGTSSHADALTGVLTLDVPEIQVNEFKIYQAYNKIYPNLEIKYSDSMINNGQVEPAYKISFYSNETIQEPYYTVLSDGTMTLASLVSKDGPTGAALTDPAKPASTTQTFTFAGKWTDGTIEYEVSNFANITPVSDLELRPIFTAQTRYYNVEFYDDTNNLVTTVTFEYNDTLGSKAETPKYLYKDDSELAAEERYAFKGWISEKNFNEQVSNPDIIDLNATPVIYDGLKLYAYYIIENATLVATDAKYFNFTQVEATFEIPVYIEPYEALNTRSEFVHLGTQWAISLKDEYKELLGGKITLPSYDPNGHKLTAIGNFKNSNITHVYCLKDAAYQIVISDSGGFSASNKLVHVSLPKTLEYIGNYGFAYCSSLKTYEGLDNVKGIGSRAFDGADQIEINELPKYLMLLGERAFYGCQNLICTQLPEGLTQLHASVFARASKVNLGTLGKTLGANLSALDNNIIFIGQQAFLNAGKDIKELTLNNSIKYLGYGCFSDYGSSTSLSVTDKTGLINAENQYSYFGRDVTGTWEVLE